jgi:hypothetical protein
MPLDNIFLRKQADGTAVKSTTVSQAPTRTSDMQEGEKCHRYQNNREQRKIYIKMLYIGAEFVGIIVATANTYQRLENKFVLLELTAAEQLGRVVGLVDDRLVRLTTWT